MYMYAIEYNQGRLHLHLFVMLADGVDCIVTYHMQKNSVAERLYQETFIHTSQS